MTDHNDHQQGKPSTVKRVFVSRARVLPDEKRGALTDKEKEFEASCRDRGVWLELFCPADACLTEPERFDMPVYCADPKARKNVFLELFCPEDSCAVTEPTQLP